jgi:uncharacterized membrane protein (DUF2068 family)
MKKVPPTAVVWLLVGVNAKQAELDTNRALTLLRKEGYTANTATPASIFAKAQELRDKATPDERKAIEK